MPGCAASVAVEAGVAGGILIGVGRACDRACDSPSLRTGRADLPHPALQLVVLPLRGLTCLLMGCRQREQPLLQKESVGPAVMIGPSATAAKSLPLAQNTP